MIHAAIITLSISCLTAFFSIIYFAWQFSDRQTKSAERMVATAVDAALQAERNKSALQLLEQKISFSDQMLDYRIKGVEGFLDRTTEFQPRCLPGDDRCNDRKN
jgi:hypothetical protein